MLPRIGIVITAIGIVLFLLGLYGVGGLASGPTLSMTASVVGCGLLIAGLGVSAWHLRHADIGGPHRIAVLLGATAVLLHGYEHLFLADEFSAGSLAWVMTPYILFLLISCIVNMRVPAVAAIAVVLFVDLTVHYDVFIAPKSSTAALAVLFVPLWNMLVFAPVALLLAWTVQRARGRRLANVP